MIRFMDKGVGSLKKRGLSLFFVALAFLISVLIFFYDLFKGRFLLIERDLAPYFIPPRFFWVESIKRGDFPLWNPYQFSGHPFFANPQHAILYPLNWLFFTLPFDIAFNLIILLHFFLGGFFTYLFLRDLKSTLSGAFIGGLIFMLSGYLLSVHSLLTILLSGVWTPLILLFFRRVILKRSLKDQLLTAFFMTVAFLGGGIEIVYGNFFVLLLMVIFLPSTHSSLFEKGNSAEIQIPISLNFRDMARMKNWFTSVGLYAKRVKSLLRVSVLFFILSAIQLLPFLELWMNSIRSQGVSYQEATIWSFAPKDLLLFFLPDAYGYFLDMKKYWLSQCWLKTLYTGGLPFILSLTYLLTSPSPHGERAFGKDRKLFLSMMIFSILFSLGHYNPIYPFLFKYIPFLNGIRYPVKFLYFFILTLSVTAGLGFDRLKSFSLKGKRKGFKYLLITLSLFSGFILLFSIFGQQEILDFLKKRGIDFPHYNPISTNLYHSQRFFFYLTLFFLLLRIGYEVRWKAWAQVLLIFFLIADLFGNMGFYGKERTRDYFQKTKILELISSDPGEFRIFSTPKTISLDTPIFIPDPSLLKGVKERHLPSLNLLYFLRDIWGIDVIRLKRTNDLYRALTETPSISSTPLVELYGIGYVISVTPIEDPRFELIYSLTEGLPGEREELLQAPTIKLYKSRIPPKRAWLVKEVKVMDKESILLKIKNQEINVKEEVLLEEDPGFSFSLNSPKSSKSINSMDKIEWISETNNRLHLWVHTSEDSILFLNETYYPGWKAFIDGREVKIYRADYNFRAIFIPSGSHRIEFIYDPLSFKLGAGITLLGMAGCLVWIVFGKRRRRVT